MIDMKALPLVIGLAVLLTGSLRAQRPKNVNQAVERFEDVRDQGERNRHQAVRDLGRFGEDASTQILVAELQRAESNGYRNTVVLALGNKARQGAVPPLLRVMTTTSNVRMAETAANALRKQGKDGVAALVQELPQSAGNKRLRDAICYSLGRLEQGDASRDALLKEIERTTRKDRQAAVRGLEARRGDALVDAVRIKLVGEKDTYLASLALEQLAFGQHQDSARLAISLARRLPAQEYTSQHTAVLVALLNQPQPEHYQALLFAAARANKPFRDLLMDRWRECLATGVLVDWLRAKGTKAKEDGMQIAAARALALSPEEHHATAIAGLEVLLKKRSLAVARSAATALVALGLNAQTKAPLQSLINKGDAAKAPIAITALHSAQRADNEWLEQLFALCKHKRPSIRAAALRALLTTSADSDQRFTAAAENLDHRAWQVRSVALDLLLQLRSAKSPPLLFARLEKEKARLRQDVQAALRELTGLQFATEREWVDWWSSEGDRFEPRKPADTSSGRGRDTATVSYWNIPVHSDRVAFVVDTSGSMLKPFGTGNATRLGEAKRQLRKVFEALPAKAKMNVITFAGDARGLFPKLQALSKRKRAAADEFVEALGSKGPTNVYDAVRLAFDDPDVDTIFLLTDGQPSAGAIVDRDRLAAEIGRWNASRSIRIHTIAIGQKSDLLARLAKDSGGEHRVSR